MNDGPKKDQARVIRPSYLLRSKIGVGSLPPRVLARFRRVFDSNTVDFAPMAIAELDKLKSIIDEAKERNLTRDEAAARMTDIVMQLKANASMFNYPLIGKLAAIMLGFLESVKEIDDHAIEIVSAHHDTLRLIIQKGMRGHGGSIGRNLEEELKQACARYFKKS